MHLQLHWSNLQQILVLLVWSVLAVNISTTTRQKYKSKKHKFAPSVYNARAKGFESA
jgi:hypothetical protein